MLKSTEILLAIRETIFRILESLLSQSIHWQQLLFFQNKTKTAQWELVSVLSLTFKLCRLYKSRSDRAVLGKFSSMAITSNNKTQQGKEARHETAGLQKQIIFLLTFHLILKFWAGPWFRRTHCCERPVLMSYIKTKWGVMGLFSSTSLFSTTSWHLGTGIGKMQWIREARNLFFFFF